MTADRGVSVRSATSSDIPRLAAILAENDEPIGWPDRPGWPYLEHLVDRSRAVVAETHDAVAGFGGSIAVGRDPVRFLTDLFVGPEHQERGVGAALLEALLDDAPGRMTFSSDDERALRGATGPVRAAGSNMPRSRPASTWPGSRTSSSMPRTGRSSARRSPGHTRSFPGGSNVAAGSSTATRSARRSPG